MCVRIPFLSTITKAPSSTSTFPFSMKMIDERSFSGRGRGGGRPGSAALLTRAADVVLKERRRLVLMARETPLHLGHLRSMVTATEIGAIIYPPVPAFYAKPTGIEQMVDQTLGRVLDLFNIRTDVVNRWEGLTPTKARDVRP